MAKILEVKKRVGACGEPTNSKTFFRSVWWTESKFRRIALINLFVGKVSVASNKPLNFRGWSVGVFNFLWSLRGLREVFNFMCGVCKTKKTATVAKCRSLSWTHFGSNANHYGLVVNECACPATCTGSNLPHLLRETRQKIQVTWSFPPLRCRIGIDNSVILSKNAF